MSRQQYTLEFKRRAVALLLESGKSAARMTQEFDIKENTSTTKKRYQDKAGLLSPTPQFSEQELEIRRLKAKIFELEEDKLIRKKRRRSLRGKSAEIRHAMVAQLSAFHR